MASPKSSPPRPKTSRARSATGALVLQSPTARPKVASLAVPVAPDVLEVLSPRASTVRRVAETLGQAIHRSQQSGQADGFTVMVDAEGNYDITPLAAPAPAASEEERIDHAFESARERGRIRAVEILDRQDMLTADQFAARLGVSRVTVNARRQKHELLGLDGAKRGYRFPAWQVDEDGKAFDALPQLFELLGPSPWGVYRFLTQRHNVLNGATAKDVLRRGQVKPVLDAAESLARGDFS